MYISPINVNSHNQYNTNTNFKTKKIPTIPIRTRLIPVGTNITSEGLLKPMSFLHVADLELFQLSALVGCCGLGAGIIVADDKDEEKPSNKK